MIPDVSNQGAPDGGGSLSVSTDNSSFVVIGPPKVTSQLRIIGHGKILGTVKAEYDFTDCPKEWHQLALRSLMVTPPGDIVVDILLRTPEEVAKDREELRRLERNLNLGYIGRFFMWIGIGKWLGLKEYDD